MRGGGVAGTIGSGRPLWYRRTLSPTTSASMSRNRGWSLTDAARDAEIDLHPGGDREGAMGRQFQATIPGQRGHEPVRQPPHVLGERCFRHQLLLPSPYLVLTKQLRLDIQCQRAASVKIGWKYLDD